MWLLQDEMRPGLKPVVRRVWTPGGKRPLAKVRRRYEWLCLYGFASEVGAGEGKGVLLVLDQAGWHTANGVEVPEGVHLEYLPAIASPELQPAQRL